MVYLNAYDLYVDETGNVYRRFQENLKGKPKGDICLMRTYTDKDGYLFVQWCKDKKRHHAKVHRLVAMAFIPNPDGLETVDHVNRIRNDNRVENLRWASRKMQSDNTRYVDNSIKKYGVRCCDNPSEYHRRYKEQKRGYCGN
jgi:hypothetical protein